MLFIYNVMSFVTMIINYMIIKITELIMPPLSMHISVYGIMNYGTVIGDSV